MMTLGTIVKASFIVGLVITLTGAWLKITHSDGAESLLLVGILANLLFVVTAIYEVRTSTRIDRSEKTMWTVAFILFSGIAGAIYLLMGRKRIVLHH